VSSKYIIFTDFRLAYFLFVENIKIQFISQTQISNIPVGLEMSLHFEMKKKKLNNKQT